MLRFWQSSARLGSAQLARLSTETLILEENFTGRNGISLESHGESYEPQANIHRIQPRLKNIQSISSVSGTNRVFVSQKPSNCLKQFLWGYRCKTWSKTDSFSVFTPPDVWFAKIPSFNCQFQLWLEQMEGAGLTLNVVLITLGTFFWVALIAVGCFCLHQRRKRLRNADDDESMQVILPEQAKQSPVSINSRPPSMAKKLKNGIIGGFRSPLVRTRSVG